MENKIRYRNGLGRPCIENPLHKIVVRIKPTTRESIDSIGAKNVRNLIAKAMEDKIYG